MKVLLLTARIRLETEGGVIGTEAPSGEGNDLRLRRDPAGVVHLPGTSVAGSLRAHCGSDLDDLFGSRPEERKSSPDDDDFQPSPIQVLGTRYFPVSDETVQHVRTAINRKRGAAENNTLHRVEQLHRGTEFEIALRWNDPDQQRRAAFLEKLQSWHPRLGRGVTSGAGRCRLIGWGSADYDLDTSDGLLAWLRDTGLDAYPKPANEPVAPDVQTPLDIRMTIVDGLRCGVGDDDKPEGEARKIFRLNGVPAIPGSTLKGILRSRAEYICRVLGVDICGDWESDEEARQEAAVQQAKQQCGACLPCQIFGAGGANAKRGAIAVPTALIEQPKVEERPHVAIDRFSGGYKDGALYHDELVVTGHFRLRVEALVEKFDEPAVSLLKAVVCDLHDGLIGIGESTTRGYGTVRVDDPAWKRPDLSLLAAQLGKAVA